jgi:hypothetical protein
MRGPIRGSEPTSSELTFASKITIYVAKVRHIHTGLLTFSLEFRHILSKMTGFAVRTPKLNYGNDLVGRWIHCCANMSAALRQREHGPRTRDGSQPDPPRPRR